MKRTMTALLFFIVSFALLTSAYADDAALRIHGDLMIHPDQEAEFFNIGGNQIRNSAVWSWPSLQFQLPYKTSWTNVLAHGPFNVQFDTTSLKNQEFGFSLSWENPQLTVGKFDIHDTVNGVANGVPYTVNLDGSCTNMDLKIPGGAWVIKGKMHWDFNANAFVVAWEDFSLTMNSAAVPVVNLGQCQGPTNLMQTLHDTVIKIAGDHNWLQEVLKAGVQDWVQTTLGTLQAQLLVPREVKLKENIKLQWSPGEMTTMAGGLIRVAGTFKLSKNGSTVGADQLPRNYDPSTTLVGVPESGFVFPRDSMQRILRYLYSNGELQYRANSNTVAGFVSLMNSRFLQFFVWPDLMSFDTSTNFIFDIGTQGVPVLGAGGMLDGGGSAYPFTSSMLVHQWAPDAKGKSYVPYVDFTAPLTGTFNAMFNEGTLTLQMQTDDLQIADKFRPEYSKIRQVTDWISTWLLGSSVNDYLNSTSYSVTVPNWQVGPTLSLGMRDFQAWKQTVRIPLQFKALTPSP